MNVLKHEVIITDLHENYYKQTNRNRCNIITANGIMPLIIPVKTLGNHTAMKDVKIDYSTPWQRVHLHAIKSAYANAPYFEHYRKQIDDLYSTQPSMLYEWNSKCFALIATALKLQWNPLLAESYIEPTEEITDLRSSRISKSLPEKLNLRRYQQVFEERHGFAENLSVLDLLFCCGPSGINYLKAR